MANLNVVISPYSHESKLIELERYLEVMKFVADRLRRYEFCISPIVHCHELSLLHDLPTDWKFWDSYCKSLIDVATEVHVCCLPGWEVSIGVQAEIAYALSIGKKVLYFQPI